MKKSSLPKMKPTKPSFEWLENSDANGSSVPKEAVLETYRLDSDRCFAGKCKRNCRNNPRCLSAIGATALLRDGEKSLPSKDDDDSLTNCRELSEPAGLKNLGATCYLNSLLQVWFHNLIFRKVILEWNQTEGEKGSVPGKPDSVIGHMQLIFARLLRSRRRSVDPTALVELLGLDTEYQQDASECSALLFSLILDQLRAYQGGKLAYRLEDAFAGKQATVIKCEGCNYEKKIEQSFYNIILNVQGHRDIRQCIKALGVEKKIQGDFQCSFCCKKNEATTFEEFSQMPAVLNLQLMRYQYDPKNGTKKKLQTPIRFPETLDVSPYINDRQEPLLYGLKAVLVHIGSSANNGHYIANVKESSSSTWYRLNDENVSIMKGRLDLNSNLIDRSDSKKNIDEPMDTSNGTETQQQDDKSSAESTSVPKSYSSIKASPDRAGDEEAAVPEESAANSRPKGKRGRAPKVKESDDPNTFSSTGAYMLVYGACSDETDNSQVAESTMQKLHPYLEETIVREQTDFSKTCSERLALRESTASSGLQLLKDFNEAYAALPYVPDEAYRFVLCSSITKVFKSVEQRLKEIRSVLDVDPTDSPAKKKIGTPSENGGDQPESLCCPHNHLSPESNVLWKIKVISQKGFESLDQFCDNHHLPKLSAEEPLPQTLCEDCVAQIGRRSLLSQKLAEDVKTFNRLMKQKSSDKLFFIDSKCLQSWAKMAENSCAEEFNAVLRCTHGNLGLSPKKAIPEEAWAIVKSYFPNHVEFTADTHQCFQCEEDSSAQKARATEHASAINNIKQKLQGLSKHRRTFNDGETEAFGLNLSQATALWKLLRVNSKSEQQFDDLENELICEHHKCKVKIDSPTLPEDVVILSAEEWDVINATFKLKSPVKIRFDESSFVTDPEPCEECLVKRDQEMLDEMKNFQNISIPVVKLSLEQLLDQQTAEAEPVLKKQKTSRKGRVPNARTIIISSTERFVDLKVKIMTKYQISPILQTLLIDSVMVRDQDGQTLIKDLGVRTDSIIYVAEDRTKAVDDDATNSPIKEEIGFGGTKLLG